mmetsp:Transcript_2769/g.5385  ORF Transcript_2769/g.5385 Transcript_2769/m.5385 type:complete len:86 (+) Transcript_2769:621-878(+)
MAPNHHPVAPCHLARVLQLVDVKPSFATKVKTRRIVQHKTQLLKAISTAPISQIDLKPIPRHPPGVEYSINCTPLHGFGFSPSSV